MQGISTSITGRAMAKGVISVEAVNIRDYTKEKHGHVDDAPYGGGAGMVMQAQPICDCYHALLNEIAVKRSQGTEECKGSACEKMEGEEAVCEEPACAEEACAEAESSAKKPRVIYLTPQGKVFTQKLAEELAKEQDLIFLCGHYEGVDERALELLDTENISIGDYVLTGGELPAMVMIDCISRLVPGVLGKDESADIESFHDNLLEYPQYTRPEVYEERRVPEILLSGHHANIEAWRREQSIRRTLSIRPDLLSGAQLSKKEQKFLDRLRSEQRAEDDSKNQSAEKEIKAPPSAAQQEGV